MCAGPIVLHGGQAPSPVVMKVIGLALRRRLYRAVLHHATTSDAASVPIGSLVVPFGDYLIGL